MADLRIDQALVKLFVDSAFGLPIAHENDNYEPTAGTSYAEIFVLQNDTTPFSLSDSNETDGVFRVILRYKLDKGAIAAKTMADTIFQAFGIGLRVVYDSATLTIINHSRQQGIPEDGWYKLVLSIGYKAVIRR